MKTHKIQLNEFLLDKLRHELFKKIGYRISNKPDCAKLSDLLIESGLGYVSESTLYRLFFQFEKHNPYKSTLDILCNYLGYHDSIEFFEKANASRHQMHWNCLNTVPKKSRGLFFHFIEHRVKEPLIDFFEEVNELDHQFKTDINLAIFDGLVKTSKQDWFFKEFAQNDFIREYFFELGHDPKFRIDNYDFGYQIYLKSVCRDVDIQNFQDFIFGNSVLFRHYFVTQKHSKALKYAEVLYKHDLRVDKYQNDLYIFPFIRYTAYKLWYLQIIRASPAELEGYARYLINLCSILVGNLDKTRRRILFHTVAEAFLHSHLSNNFGMKLKNIFVNDFQRLPKLVFNKHLKYSLPYFEQNGLLHFRP